MVSLFPSRCVTSTICAHQHHTYMVMKQKSSVGQLLKPHRFSQPCHGSTKDTVNSHVNLSTRHRHPPFRSTWRMTGAHGSTQSPRVPRLSPGVSRLQAVGTHGWSSSRPKGGHHRPSTGESRGCLAHLRRKPERKPKRWRAVKASLVL